MSDFSDRLLIDLKTSMSESELHFLHTRITMGEAELHFLHARMIGGKENAASRGELRFPLPSVTSMILAVEPLRIPTKKACGCHTFQSILYYRKHLWCCSIFRRKNLFFSKRAYKGARDGKLT